ncbi:hypothetical protein BKH41_08895 [Helicobacter sp. 12S02232-10]|uniref:hypothetical protein n=1 Tax=Helicobacter sp. 12S02232-10 TaxID=1476197 RepID=UPI000BA698D3|nr:hypothetical protein [Helicobacter sp. 12S02232-10]PAF46612.1 hypothetical protein BKH41_08895 [Helicobacter sp. 12S02232-10]
MPKFKATPNLKLLHRELYKNKKTLRDQPNAGKELNIFPDSNDMLSSRASIAVIADIIKRILPENQFKKLTDQIKQESLKNENYKEILNIFEKELVEKNSISNTPKQKPKTQKLRVTK